MEAMARLLLLFSVISVSLASKSGVPVLLWTNEKSQSYPAPLTGHSVDADAFHSKFLKNELTEGKKNLVVFLQDKLSLEDFSQHADVYNTESDGATFHNLKTIMETQPSTHISSLSSASDLLALVRDSFKGKVHELSDEYSVKDLSLDKAANLVLVNLPPTKGLHVKKSLQKIDEILGSVTSQMEEHDLPFTALYTGLASSKPMARPAPRHEGRHLLAVAAEDKASFWNVSGCLFVYGESLVFEAMTFKGEEGARDKYGNITLPASSDYEKESTCNNGTASLVVKYKDIPTNNTLTLDAFAFKMDFTVIKGFWALTDFELTYKGKFEDKDIQGNEEKMSNRTIRDVTAPARKYSYHCSYQPPFSPANSSNGDIITQLRVFQFQVQLLEDYQSEKFGQVNDCIGFFTIPIWSTIISLSILLSVFFFGFCMLVNIDTMDRFDDPKGKPMQVNVME